MTNSLDFSHNWNQKLYATYFTTLRLSGRHAVGDRVEVYLKKECLGAAVIIDKKEIRLAQINDWMAMLDTGYPAKETRTILETMYRNVTDWDRRPIYYYLVHMTSRLAPLPTKFAPAAAVDLFTLPSSEE